MKIKHHDIEISKDNPFDNCKLNREPYAKVLTEIIKSYADGFVLAINNEWGTGKTTFAKMWKQLLINEGFQAIYFNAWENDFNSNPLVAIISELKPLTKGKVDREQVFKSVIEKGAVLTKNIAPALVKSIIKKYVLDTDVLDDAIENATKAATEILEEEIKEYTDKKKTITEFREELEKFIEKTENKKPLVFIVDELDRCRPSYSVEVLEQLKHFFSVKGIVFVLSIDKNHLASSIKGFYGSENINTDEYLRRFIDLEYSIPHPSTKAFVLYLFNYYGLDEYFNSPERKKFEELKNDGEYLVKVAELLFTKGKATLRQQEKIFGQTRLIMNTFRSNYYTFSHLLFFLVYIKVMHTDVYRKIETRSLTPQELSDAYVDIVPIEITNQYGFNLIYLDALLLHFYNNSQEHEKKITLYETDAQGKIATLLKINKNEADNNNLLRMLSIVNQDYKIREVSLDYLLKKINLIEPLIVN